MSQVARMNGNDRGQKLLLLCLRVCDVHGPHTDDPILRMAANDAYYYHQDGLGSVVALTGATGTTVALQQFDAWGNRLAAVSGGVIPQYGYTGREPDETGLIYYRARYYDPAIGRFTQRDPIGLEGGINQYSYVENDPINNTDPEGLVAVNVVGGAVNAGVGIVINIGSSLVQGSAINWGNTMRDAAVDFGVGFVSPGLSTWGRMSSVFYRGGVAGAGEFYKGSYKNETFTQKSLGAASAAAMNASGAAGKAASYLINRAGAKTAGDVKIGNVKPETKNAPAATVSSVVAKELAGARLVSAPVGAATEYAKVKVGPSQNNTQNNAQSLRNLAAPAPKKTK